MNITVTDVLNGITVQVGAIQVPIGLAATFCNTQVNVLATGNFTGACTITTSQTQSLPVAFRP